MFRLASILLLLFFSIAQAEDTRFILPRDEPSTPADGRSKRTLFNIIWGCVSTTIICAWMAIHPNIPPRERPFKATLRRLDLMFWTIVAPEILPAWALNQRLAAMTIRDMYNEARGHEKESCGIWKTVRGWFSLDEVKEAGSQAWTLKHGHFLIMGGIHLVEPVQGDSTSSDAVDTQPRTNVDAEKGPASSKLKRKEGRVTILTLEMLEELLKDREFEIQITEDEITDRSKGDALSKAIFILQSSWFIVQCIARRVQGLGLTQLELTTLALASLNGITFILWWDKPLGAQALVRVYLKRELTKAERNKPRGLIGGKTLSGSMSSILSSPCVTAIQQVIRMKKAWCILLLPLAIVAIFLFPIIALAFTFFFTVYDLAIWGSDTFSADATHVPKFYVPRHRYHMWLHTLLMMALGSIFGGIHCAGWNFPFPTDAEQELWRVASLAVTTIPIAISFIPPIMFLAAFILTRDFCLPADVGCFSCLVGIVMTVFAFIGGFIVLGMYASARFILLGQAIALLRHLPPSDFITVDWTKFYPHVI